MRSPVIQFSKLSTLLCVVGIVWACGSVNADIVSQSVTETEPGAAEEAGMFSKLFDPEDGYLDLSHFLDNAFGFFPLVTPITEPAVGTGAAFVPIFIDLPDNKKGRPNIFSGGALRTSNGSEAYLAGYSAYFQEDKWHVYGGGLKGSINLDFYGLGDVVTSSGDPLRYNLDAVGGLIGADRRVGDSPWRTGMRYLYAEVDPSIVHSGDQPLVDGSEFQRDFGGFSPSSTLSSVQLVLNYDTRNNVFTPTEGLYSELGVTANFEALGGSSDYQIVSWTGIWYRPIVDDTLFFGLRGDIAQSYGDVPFYLRPSISLRGVPALRYQGAGAAYTEAELRWQFAPRWSVLAFGGGGITWADDTLLRNTQTTLAGGAGFRYLIARRHGLNVGIDLAYGDEGSAVYIQFGSGWFRP